MKKVSLRLIELTVFTNWEVRGGGRYGWEEEEGAVDWETKNWEGKGFKEVKSRGGEGTTVESKHSESEKKS